MLTKEQLNVDYLLSHTADENEQVSDSKPISAYLVHIKITKIGMPRHFPLIMERTEPCIRILESDNQTIDKGTVRAN